MKNIEIKDLTTTTPEKVIAVSAYFSETGRKYVLHIDMVELGELSRISVIDFAHPTSIAIEDSVKRFSAKVLQKHADNWRNTPGVKELIEKILEVRKLELTEEAKAFAGLW